MHKIVEQDIEQIVNRVEPVACELSGKTVLLIGGMGFLGRKFCSIFDRLSENVLSSPCRVLSVDNMLTGTSEQDLDVNDNQLFFRFRPEDSRGKCLESACQKDLFENQGPCIPRIFPEFVYDTVPQFLKHPSFYQ